MGEDSLARPQWLEIVHWDDVTSISRCEKEELYALFVRFFKEHQSWVTNSPRSVPFDCFDKALYGDTLISVAKCLGRIVGFVSGKLSHDEVLIISSVFVHYDVRKFSVAEHLLREIIAKYSVREVVATVHKRNRAARRLFARIGFNDECSYGWCGYRLKTTGINNNDRNQAGFSTTGIDRITR